MKATFEQGTELVVSSADITFGIDWSDEGSDVFRCGPQVTVAIRASFTPAEAWEKKKYLKGERVTEGGHTYEAIVTETDENKPTVKTADWKNLGPTPENAELICTLPPEFRPAADALGSAGKVTVKTTGAVEGRSEGPDTVIFRAALVSP